MLLTCYNCSLVPDVDPQGVNSGDKCACAAPFAWSRSSFNCALDCGQIKGATGQSNKDGCECERGYRWDDELMYCAKNRYITRNDEKKKRRYHKHDDSDSDSD